MKELELVYRALGTRIQIIRAAIGMTQDDLAREIGQTRPSLANIEGGKQRIPMHVLEEIAKGLHTSPKHLLKGIWF